ncbi:MAG TPA: DCC1-like thiol-disulfide oxidoreductase family protein [Vicinamibacterales bacterium]|nr:DCC1-like thiol-disulfide oxidoreductase family protein [Vicinamibacterales bacterium]
MMPGPPAPASPSTAPPWLPPRTGGDFADLVPAGADGVVLFDGYCHLCDRSVQFVIDHDRRRVFRFAPSQSPGAAPLLARCGLGQAPGTIVFVERDGWSVRSTAAIRMARRLGLPWSLAAIALIIPAPLRDVVYRVIARNRVRWFGRRDTCRIPTPDEASQFL